MHRLENAKLLIVGAGNMCQPIIASLLQREDVKAKNITVVCGNSAGKTEANLLAYLNERGIESEGMNLTNRTKVKIDTLPSPDIFLYAAKPHQINEIMPLYRELIKDGTQLITIAAGKEAEAYKQHLSTTPKITLTIPHLPKKYYAINAPDEQHAQITQAVLSGLGKPITATSAQELANYCGIAGSSPAFLAYFMSSFAEGSEQDFAKEALLRMAGEQSPIAGSHVNDELMKRCTRYYNDWLDCAKQLYDEPLATHLVNQTIIGSFDEIDLSALSYRDFSNSVRSRRGSTNAGLMMMGDPPPNDSYGTVQEMEAQRTLATKCKAKLGMHGPEDAIKEAIFATIERTKAMATNPDDPLYGVDIEKIRMKAQMQSNKLA